MELDAFFYTHPIFRQEELTAWKKATVQNGYVTTPKLLEYHSKAKHIMSLRRGIYAVIPPNEEPSTHIIDPYQLAAKATSDSVLAYHTALDLHGIAYSIFNKLTFISSQEIKPFIYQEQLFQAVAVPHAIKKSAQQDFGVIEIQRQNLTIRVTDLARTYVDVLDRTELSGGWEEVIRSISNIAILDIDKVIEYCLMHKNRILAAKVGYFLEQREGAFKVPEDNLKQLLKMKPHTVQRINYREQEPCHLIKKWNLMLPEYVIDQNWNEPNYDV